MITLARSCEITTNNDSVITPYLPYQLTMNRMIKDGYKAHMQDISNKIFANLKNTEIKECVLALKKAINAIEIETLTKALANESGMKLDDVKKILDNLDSMNNDTIDSRHLSSLLDALHVVNNGNTFGYLIGARRAEVIFEMCFTILSNHTIDRYLGVPILTQYKPNIIELKEFLDFVEWTRSEFGVVFANTLKIKKIKVKKEKKKRDVSKKETKQEKRDRLEKEALDQRKKIIRKKIFEIDDSIKDVKIFGRAMIMVSLEDGASIKLSTPKGIDVNSIVKAVKYDINLKNKKENK